MMNLFHPEKYFFFNSDIFVFRNNNIHKNFNEAKLFTFLSSFSGLMHCVIYKSFFFQEP